MKNNPNFETNTYKHSLASDISKVENQSNFLEHKL